MVAINESEDDYSSVETCSSSRNIDISGYSIITRTWA